MISYITLAKISHTIISNGYSLDYNQGSMGGKKKKQVFQHEQQKPKTPQIVDLIDNKLMDKTEYLSFLPQDGIYSDRIHLVKDSKDLAVVMKEILKELNNLRYLNFKQFWDTIQFNLSLKYCLESCLMFLQRKKYNQYKYEKPISESEQKQEQQFEDIPPTDNDLILYQKHIYQILLIIYFRIIQAEDEDPHLAKQLKCSQLVYDNWIFDIPKLFNFMDIYGESNPEITKFMVEKVFYLNSDYILDFIDVLRIMENHVFPDILQEFKFLHERSQIQKSISKDTFQNKMKHLFIIKDLTSSFVNIFEFFPFEVCIYIITSLVLAPLENIYYQIYTAYKNWEFHSYTQNIHPLMDSIEEDLIKIWKNIFQTFRRVILQQTDMRYIKDFREIKELSIQNMNRLGSEFGVVLSQGKKGKEKRNYMLLEQLIQEFDLQSFLNQMLEIQNKTVNKQQISELLDVVVKLGKFEDKKLGSEKQESNKYLQGSNRELLNLLQQIQKQSCSDTDLKSCSVDLQNKIQIVKQEQSKRVQELQRTQNINLRQYDDEYDDFYDYNRKISQNDKNFSDSQIEEVQQNSGKFSHKNRSKQHSQISMGGKKQHKHQKYIQKDPKQDDKSDKSHYQQSKRINKNNEKEGQKSDHHYAKKQYREK